MVIVLHAHSKFFGYLAYLSGAACRVGYRDDSAVHCFTHEAVPYEGIISFREENRRIMQALGITVDNRHLEMWPTPEARAEADQIRAVALREGFADGQTRGLDEWAAERQRARELVAQMGAAYQHFCEQQVPALADLATGAAGKLLQEQLTLEPERVLVSVWDRLSGRLASPDPNWSESRFQRQSLYPNRCSSGT